MDLRKQVLLGMTNDERISFMLKCMRLTVERMEKHVRDSGFEGQELRQYRLLMLKGFKPSKAREQILKWRQG